MNEKVKKQEKVAPSYWIEGIQEILAQYKSKAEWQLFKEAKNSLRYEECKGVPISVFTDMATIIAYCSSYILENLRNGEGVGV